MANVQPLCIVPLSAGLYALTYSYLRNLHAHTSTSARADNKLISAVHSIIVTSATLIALTREWPFSQPRSHHPTEKSSTGLLDDSENPLITTRSDFANAITSWETGYLVYDTCCMFLRSSHTLQLQGRSTIWTSCHTARTSPVFLAHHLALLGALGVLQGYIVAARERGVMVILAFFLMNASNPLLHLRWFQKRRNRRTTLNSDLSMAVTFALTRFGLLFGTIKLYARHHGMGTFDALRRQRLVCRTGTGALFAVNAVWWVGLLLSMRRKIKVQ